MTPYQRDSVMGTASVCAGVWGDGYGKAFDPYAN